MEKEIKNPIKISWTDKDYVAIDYDLNIIAADKSKNKVKDKAIAAGARYPLIVQAKYLTQSFTEKFTKNKNPNAFKTAIVKKKRVSRKLQITTSDNEIITNAIDNFVKYKEIESSAKINKLASAELFQNFAVNAFITNSINNTKENLILNGKEKQCRFIIKDQTSNIKQENKDKLLSLGFDIKDLIEEVSDFSFNEEVLSKLSIKDIKTIGEFLGQYPGLLKVDKKVHAKKGLLKQLPDITKNNIELMKILIDALQYVKITQ